MRITTRGRYGLRAMVDLAVHQESGPVMMRAITERQGISRKYLHALLVQLKEAGLVRSVRGSRGGYVLARDPATISAKDVLDVLEGRVMLADCGDPGKLCRMSRSCRTRALWEELEGLIDRRLACVSIADLASGRPLPSGEAPSRASGRSSGENSDTSLALPRWEWESSDTNDRP